MPMYQYRCDNDKCEEYDKEVTIACSISEMNDQKCGKCNEPLVRSYGGKGAMIKTFGDGTKL